MKHHGVRARKNGILRAWRQGRKIPPFMIVLLFIIIIIIANFSDALLRILDTAH